MKFPNIASFLKSATTIINVSNATAPTPWQVLTATSWTRATWQTPSGWWSWLTAYDWVVAWELTTWTIFETWFASAKTLTKFKCSLKTLPTWADFIIKAYKNGVEDASVTIATTATATNWLYVSDDTTFVSGSYAENDRLTITITQIWTTISGSNLSWQVI